MSLSPTYLRTATEAFERNPFATYDPIRPLLAFHQSDHLRRMIRAPNQVSKTFGGGWEAWAHLVGRHRWRPHVRAADGLIMVADLDNTYPQVCAKLWATCPRDLLDPATRYIPGKGFYTNGARFIRSRAGKTLIFRSGEGAAMSAASATVGYVWVDEPPKRDRFGEVLSRVAVQEGPAWMTFTPINRPVDWLRAHVEGDPTKGLPPKEEWIQFRPTLTQDDCTTVNGTVIRSTASIQRQIAGYTTSEMRQRVYGDWEGISENRALSCYNPDLHCIADDLVEWADGDIEIGIGFDHGEHVGNQVAVLFYYQSATRRVHIADCYVATKATTEEDDADGVLQMLARNELGGRRLGLLNVDKMVGDINSAGKAGGGRKVNARLAEALARQAGHGEVVVPIDNARKGRVKEGVRVLNLGFLRGDLTVSDRDTLKPLRDAIQYWDGTPASEAYKHHIDAARYPIVPILDPNGDEREEGTGRMTLAV